jgi:shikimate kinase
MNIWLVGYMGAGKSRMAKKLGEKLNYEVVDTDELITLNIGMDVADIFVKYGEPYFRVLERQCGLQLSQRNHLIIATGGGVPVHSLSIDEMKTSGKVVYLQHKLDVLWDRVDADDDGRPLAASKDEFAARFMKRQPIYSQADFAYSGENAMEILELLGLDLGVSR